KQAGRDVATLPKFIEIKVSYDHDAQFALDACRWWAALALTPEEKSGVEDPIEMERLADAAADRAHTRFIVSNDPDEVVEKVGWYVERGFDHLVFHAPGDDQVRFLEQFCADVVPPLRAEVAWPLGGAAAVPPPRPRPPGLGLRQVRRGVFLDE